MFLVIFSFISGGFGYSAFRWYMLLHGISIRNIFLSSFVLQVNAFSYWLSFRMYLYNLAYLSILSLTKNQWISLLKLPSRLDVLHHELALMHYIKYFTQFNERTFVWQLLNCISNERHLENDLDNSVKMTYSSLEGCNVVLLPVGQ